LGCFGINRYNGAIEADVEKLKKSRQTLQNARTMYTQNPFFTKNQYDQLTYFQMNKIRGGGDPPPPPPIAPPKDTDGDGEP
jgi:hypothetical protein